MKIKSNIPWVILHTLNSWNLDPCFSNFCVHNQKQSPTILSHTSVYSQQEVTSKNVRWNKVLMKCSTKAPWKFTQRKLLEAIFNFFIAHAKSCIWQSRRQILLKTAFFFFFHFFSLLLFFTCLGFAISPWSVCLVQRLKPLIK